MSDSVKLTAVKNDFKVTMSKMLDRASSAQAGLSDNVYKMYQQLQQQRFMTQGASEGMSWPSLERKYEARKLKQFVSYPGAGQKMMIATSTLAGAVIGPGPYSFEGQDKHRALFTNSSMIISVEESGENAAGKPFNYPHFANRIRPFMKFSDASIQAMKDELAKFILGE